MNRVKLPAFYLTLLEIDSQHGITPIFSELGETTNRIEAKKSIELPLGIFSLPSSAW